MEIENAKIKSTFLGIEDHNIMTFSIELAGDGWGQCFGHIPLDSYNRETNKRDKDCGKTSLIIRDLLDTLEIFQWEKLPNQLCRVCRENYSSPITAIGHIFKNKWFRLEDYIKNENSCHI